MPIIVSLANGDVSDSDRRLSLFSGNLFVYGPRPSTRAFCTAARGYLEQLLGPEAIWAQQRMTEKEFTTLFDAVGRSLSKVALSLATAVVEDFGCDPSSTFVGGGSLVAVTGFGFLAHGLGMPQHPHRDIWYAASTSQLNWWIPLYDLDAGAAFAFHPLYWDVPVNNSSKDFVYDEWAEAGRWSGGTALDDRLDEPRPLVPIDLAPEIKLSCPAGGVIISSAAQLHSTVPNETLKTHFCVRFQTVSQTDLEKGVGASNLDAEARGTGLSDFVRCSDLGPMPEELIERELAHRMV